MREKMVCPRCNAELLTSDRQGVEIDHCPQCKGIWLDRGELDVLIEKTTQLMNRYQSRDDEYEFRKGHDYHKEKKHDGNTHQGRKKNFLSELFDF